MYKSIGKQQQQAQPQGPAVTYNQGGLSGIGQRFQVLTDMYEAYQKGMGRNPKRSESRAAVHGYMDGLMHATGLSHEEAARSLAQELQSLPMGGAAGQMYSSM